MPHRPSFTGSPAAAALAVLLALCAHPLPPVWPAHAGQADYNNQTVDLNALDPLLKIVEDSRHPSPDKRTEAFLEAKKILDGCVARKTPHPGLEPALKRFAAAKKRLAADLFAQANANLNEADHTKSLKFIRLLLKIDPGEKSYRTWEANLTRRHLDTNRARVYAGGDGPAASLSTLDGNRVRKFLDHAYELFLFRHFREARKWYDDTLKVEPGNVEAERRLKQIAVFEPLLDEIERLSAHVESLRHSYSLTGYDKAKFAGIAPRFDRLDADDPDFRRRAELFAPPTPPSVALIADEKDRKKLDWQRRREALKETHLRHLYHAALTRIVLGNDAAAARTLAALEAVDRDSLLAIELRVFVDDAAGRPLDALHELRDFMRAKALAANAFTLYMRLPFNLGRPEYAFVFTNHLRLYTKVYWPLELLLGVILASLAWSGHRTYRLWDEVTDGLVTRILTLSNKTPMEYFDSANACMAARNFEKAVKQFTKALDVDKGFAEGYLGRAMARLELEDTEGARADLEAHVKLRPGNGRALFHLAICYDRLGRRTEAVVTIEQAIGLGTLQREHKLEDLEKNKSLYRRVMNEYIRNAETILSVKAVATTRPPEPG